MTRTGTAPPNATPAAAHASDEPLTRAIGRWGLVALMVNGIVGAGIFGLPSRIQALAGPVGLLAFVSCAVVIGAIALCFAEVASRFTATGGPYLYAETAFGPAAGFMVGWIIWVARVSAVASITQVLASYAGFLWPAADAGWTRRAVITAVTVALTALNLHGVRGTSRSVNLLTIAKLVPLLMFVAVGMAFVDRHAFAGARWPGPQPFSQAVLQLVFAFGGFEATVIAAGEMKDPRRDTPFALVVALAGVTLLYVAIQAVCIGTLPALAGSTRPVADAASRFMGRLGGVVVTVGALVSSVGTLCATLLVAPRVLFAMAERGHLPARLAATHPTRRTPELAIIVSAAVALGLSLNGSFAHWVGVNVIVRIVTYASTAVALIVLRRRAGAAPAAFRVPLGGIVAALALLACVALVAQSGGAELRDAAVAIGAGAVLYAITRLTRRGRRGVPSGVRA